MRKRNKELPDWDDGRTIADMSPLDGAVPRRNAGPRPPRENGRTDSGRQISPLAGYSKEESRAFTWGAVKAVLLVAAVMCAGLVLFVLFCQYVWFR